MKNLHIEHIEDLVLKSKVQGSLALFALKDVFYPTAYSLETEITVKWDGAPAIVCGYDPENGKFFVGTKSVFNKITPKICYTNEDVDKWYLWDFRGDSSNFQFAQMLKACLHALPNIIKSGVWQGDILFHKHPEEYRVLKEPFGMNVLQYYPKQILDTEDIARSHLGIAFHTEYIGKSLTEMDVFFSNAKDYPKTGNGVWIAPVKAVLPKKLPAKVKKDLAFAEAMLNQIPDDFDYEQISDALKAFLQSQKEDPKAFDKYINDFYQSKADKYKLESYRQKANTMVEKMTDFVNKNEHHFRSIFLVHKTLIDIKAMILKALDKEQSKYFDVRFNTSNERNTTHEGYVINLANNMLIKLVDRNEFSRTNQELSKFRKNKDASSTDTQNDEEQADFVSTSHSGVSSRGATFTSF